MGRALLIIGALATLGFLASGVLGYLLGGPADAAMPRHVLVALAACLAQLFSHSWILIYLFITGWAIRETVRESGLEERYVEEARRFKISIAPWGIAAVILGVATFLLGGAAQSGAVKVWIHHGLFYATVVVQTWALWQEFRALRANHALIQEIDRRVAGLGAPGLSGQEVAG
jgi:hypothetical protein